MKKQLLFFLSVFTLLALGVDAQVINENYYGFEIGEDNLIPVAPNAGWGSKNLTTTKVNNNFTISDAQFNSGSYSLKFEVASEITTASTFAIYTLYDGNGGLKNITGGAYRLSYNIFIESTSDFSGSGNFELRLMGDATKSIGTDITTIAKGSWQPVSVLVDLVDFSDDTQTRGSFRFKDVLGAGTIYIDDVKLEEVLPTSVQFNITQDAAVSGNHPNIIIDGVQYKADQAVSGQDNTKTTDSPITLEAGTYDYVVTSNGSDIYYGSVSVANGEEKTTSVTIAPLQSGQFVYEYTDNSVIGKQIPLIVKDDQDRVVSIGNTSNAGKYWASGLPAGTYTYELDGFTGTLTAIGRNRNFRIEKSVASINIGLSDENLANVTDAHNATVVLTDGVNTYNGVANSAGGVTFDGNASIDGVAGTSYDYTVSATGYITKSGTITPVANEVDFYEIILEVDGATNIGDPNEDKCKIYPNPADEIFTIEGASSTILSIYSMAGDLVKQQYINAFTQQVNIANLARGLYIVKIEGSNIEKVSKLQVK